VLQAICKKRVEKMYIFLVEKNIIKKQVKFLLFLLNKNSLIVHLNRISSLAHRDVPQIRYGSTAGKILAVQCKCNCYFKPNISESMGYSKF
jgi:hypothetical protein